MKQLKQSETRIIWRSSIQLNPVNPKRHTSENINLQKRNLQKVGYLGGIVWNETTGNLVDGHRRLRAMDLYYKYDGTKSTDYKVKVEVVQLDEKQEKEQLTYMAVGNTKADIDLIAQYAPDIDLSNVGLSQNDLNDIMALTDIGKVDIPDLSSDFIDSFDENTQDSIIPDSKPEEKTDEEKKEHVKKMKEEIRKNAEKNARDESAYIMLSFSDYDAYLTFCEMAGVNEGDKFVKGEDILKLFE